MGHGLTRGCHGLIRSRQGVIGHTWPHPEGMAVRSGHTCCSHIIVLIESHNSISLQLQTAHHSATCPAVIQLHLL